MSPGSGRARSSLASWRVVSAIAKMIRQVRLSVALARFGRFMIAAELMNGSTEKRSTPTEGCSMVATCACSEVFVTWILAPLAN